MTIQEFAKLKQYIEEQTQGLEKAEATKVKKEILNKAGVFLKEYKQMEDMMDVAVEQAISQSKQEIYQTIASVAQELSDKIDSKPPQVINKIVKVVEKPTTVKETVYEDNSVHETYDDTQLKKEISEVRKSIENIKIPEIDLEKFREEFRNDFMEDFQKNTSMLGMPDFRQLGVGLQGQIDNLSEEIANATIAGGSVYSVNGNTGDVVLTTSNINSSTDRRYVTDSQLANLQTTSGVNTGDQTITLTGAVTGSGTGSFATTLASGIDATKIADGSISNAEFQRLNGVTSDIQTQLDGKSSTSHTHTLVDITDVSASVTQVNYLNTTTSNVQTQLNAKVGTTGDETIAGVKTFSSIPVLPASDPTTSNQAVRKSYVDAIAQSVDVSLYKTSCALATTENISLTGEQTIDGTLTSTTRILVKNQTAPAENGIYVTAAGAWSRATDYNTVSEVVQGTSTFITGGSTNINKLFVMNATTPTTLDTDPVTFTQLAGLNSYNFAVGTTGTDFNVDVSGSNVTYHLPTASATKRGVLSSADWSTFNGKAGLFTGSGATTNVVPVFRGTGSFIQDSNYKISTSHPANGFLAGNFIYADNPWLSTTSGNLRVSGYKVSGTGSATIIHGGTTESGTGGYFEISGGDSYDGAGGDLYIKAGEGTTVGGSLYFYTSDWSYYSLWDLSSLTGNRTHSLPDATTTLLGTDNTATITNKRITKRTGTVASSATPTINTDNVDFFSITALAVDVTSFTTNLSGTPTNAQTLWISITDNGTSRALTWGASFEASGNVALPTTTTVSTRLDVGFVWNTVTNKWRCVAVA